MISLGTDVDGHERLAKRRRYRIGYYGSVIVAVVALFVAMRFGYPLVGIGLYWIGATAMFGFLWLSPLQLFDERERALQRRAADVTLNVIGVAGVVTIPAVVALELTGHLTITPTMAGLGLAFVGLYAVLGAVSVLLWLRR